MKNLKNNRQKGFTLIELVIVIVILGILAATAAPKFIDLTGDARTAVMQGLEGALNSGTSGIYAKAIIAGDVASSATTIIGAEHYNLAFGFPAAAGVGASNGTSGAAFGISGAITTSFGSDVTIAASGGVTTFTNTSAPDPSTCVVTYTQSSVAGQVPLVTSVIGGC